MEIAKIINQDNLASSRQNAAWDVRNSIGNYATLVCSHFASAFFSLISVWLITRAIGNVGYGGVVAIIGASSLAQIFVNWTGVALVRYGVEEFTRTGRINETFWARSLILAVNSMVILSFYWLWLPILLKNLKLSLDVSLLVIIHFIVTASWVHIQQSLQAAKLPRFLGALLATEKLLVFVMLGVLSIGNCLSNRSAITSIVAVAVVLNIVGLIRLHKLIVPVVFKAEWGKTLLRFSLPMIPFSIFGYFAGNYLDAIFILHYLTSADLGIYSLAYQAMGIFMQFPVLAGSLILPLFVTLKTQHNITAVESYIQNVLPFAVMIWGTCCVGFATISSFLLPLVFSSEFDQSSELLVILTMSACLSAPMLLGYGPLINAHSATIISAALNIALAITNLIGNIILIPRFGLVGSAWATNGAYAVSLIVTYMLLQHRHPIRDDWTLISVLPTILGLSVAVWYGSVLLALPITLLLSLLLIAWYRDSLDKTFRTLAIFRSPNSVA